MQIKLRTPTSSDWNDILALAHAAVPWDTEGNQEWLQNRQQFSGRRQHYLAQDQATDEIVGYGAVEEGPDSDIYRIFVVMEAELLEGGVGDVVLQHLLQDLVKLGAVGLWAREYASDEAIVPFFLARGFTERSRFTEGDAPEMIVLQRYLTP